MSMLSSKKAQGLSLNTIIIAIIVLIVLVVIVMIFTGYFGKIFTPTASGCAAQGGDCKLPADCTGAFTGQTGRYVVTKDCRDITATTPVPGAAATAVCCLRGQ